MRASALVLVTHTDSTASLRGALLSRLLAAVTQHRRYDFHLVFTHSAATKSLLYYRTWQQHAWQLKHVRLVAAADGSTDLRANSQGSGFAVTDTSILIDFSTPAWGPVASEASLCSQEVGSRSRKWRGVTMDMSSSWSLLTLWNWFWSCLVV